MLEAPDPARVSLKRRACDAAAEPRTGRTRGGGPGAPPKHKPQRRAARVRRVAGAGAGPARASTPRPAGRERGTLGAHQPAPPQGVARKASPQPVTPWQPARLSASSAGQKAACARRARSAGAQGRRRRRLQRGPRRRPAAARRRAHAARRGPSVPGQPERPRAAPRAARAAPGPRPPARAHSPLCMPYAIGLPNPNPKPDPATAGARPGGAQALRGRRRWRPCR